MAPVETRLDKAMPDDELTAAKLKIENLEGKVNNYRQITDRLRNDVARLEGLIKAERRTSADMVYKAFTWWVNQQS